MNTSNSLRHNSLTILPNYINNNNNSASNDDNVESTDTSWTCTLQTLYSAVTIIIVTILAEITAIATVITAVIAVAVEKEKRQMEHDFDILSYVGYNYDVNNNSTNSNNNSSNNGISNILSSNRRSNNNSNNIKNKNKIKNRSIFSAKNLSKNCISVMNKEVSNQFSKLNFIGSGTNGDGFHSMIQNVMLHYSCFQKKMRTAV